MARVTNALSNHIERWVLPAARELLIQEACKGVSIRLLGEIAAINMGQSPDSDSINDDGEGIPFIGGPADLGIKIPETSRWTKKPKKLCEPDDIIVCVRATIGEPRWSDGIYCLGRGVAGIRPQKTSIDRKFLFRIVQANERLLYEKGTGTTFKTISKVHLAGINVPMLPLEKQKMIGEYLEWLEISSKTHLNFNESPKLPENIQHVHKIVGRIEAVAGRVEEARRLRREAVEEVNAFLLSGYNQAFQPRNDWQNYRVRDFCENPQYGYTESATSEPIGPKFLRITDIQDGKVDWNSVPYCECTQPEKYLLKSDDIVFARTGATTGKSFLIRECPEAVFASYLIRIRVKHSVTPDYLYNFFQSPNYWAQITGEKKGTGQPNVNGQKLANVLVPVPSLDEQRRIAAYLDELQGRVDELRRLQAESGRELEALMPSVLERAFRGEM